MVDNDNTNRVEVEKEAATANRDDPDMKLSDFLAIIAKKKYPRK